MCFCTVAGFSRVHSLTAALHGVKIAFHLEPYAGRTAYTVKMDLAYIREHYGGHDGTLAAARCVAQFPSMHFCSSALLKAYPKRRREGTTRRAVPVYYVYDSYHVSVLEWAQVLGPEGRLTVRGTRDDGVFIGLWLDITHGRGMVTVPMQLLGIGCVDVFSLTAELFQSGFDGAYTYFASGLCDCLVCSPWSTPFPSLAIQMASATAQLRHTGRK
jgi:glycoprotein endo-alpha-1,2-mannosidase